MIAKPCLTDKNVNLQICPEPGNCDKCLISKADCSYWWMVEMNRTEINRRYRNKIMQARNVFYQKVGESCFFCGSTGRLNCHKKDFKKHTRIAHLTIAQIQLENPNDYSRLCYPCHFGVHWLHDVFGLEWEDIINLYCGMDKSGLSHLPHKQENTGSNPVPAK